MKLGIIACSFCSNPNKTLCERTLRRRGCGIYGECGGIVRNAIWWGKVSIMSMEGMEW